MKFDIDEELHGRLLGWICPQCGRVHAPFVMECFYCNDKLKSNEIKLDPCIITPPWESDYSKYKSLDELNNIKNSLNKDSNDDMWPTEQEVKDHLKYIKEQTEAEKNIIDDNMSYWVCSRCGKIHLVFPEGGCECDAPLEYLTYVI